MWAAEGGCTAGRRLVRRCPPAGCHCCCSVLHPMPPDAAIACRFEHLALEYDEDEIGDLEEQGDTIRGFADVKGALRCRLLAACLQRCVRLPPSPTGSFWSALPSCFLSCSLPRFPCHAEFDNLLDEFLEVHGSSQSAHEVRAGRQGASAAATALAPVQLSPAQPPAQQPPCLPCCAACRATCPMRRPASARCPKKWSSLALMMRMPALRYKR